MNARKTALAGILLALSLVLSYAETLIPLSFSIPGIKLGFPNILIVFALYKMGILEACMISFLRVLLSGLLFGNVYSLAYSVAGAVLSLAVMIFLKKFGHFGTVGVSVAGGVAHNAGQIVVAIVVLGSAKIAYYLPVLCVSGVVAGIVVGIIAAILCKRIHIRFLVS